MISPPTPLPSSLFHSSVVPTENERDLVLQSIQHSEHSISALDHEIERLQLSLAKLQSQRTVLEEDIAQKVGILSPLRRLPPEVLAEIFHHIGPSVTWPCDKVSAINAPWTLGGICSYWRSVSISLPQLWSTLHIDLSRVIAPGPEFEHRAEGLVKTCLQRSANEQLDVTLRYCTNSSRDSSDEDRMRGLTRSLLKSLVGASTRWQTITLDLEDLLSFQSILSSARSCVPCLKKVHLARTEGQLLPQIIDAFSDAPRLVKLSLQNIQHPTSHLRLPWGQLKSLVSKGSTFLEGEFSTILKAAKLLEELVTEDERVLEIGNNASSGTIYLPYLRSLSVVNKSSYITRIFQLITTPLLSSLSIVARTSLPNTDLIIAMLKRSRAAHKIRFLEVQTSQIVDAAWAENYGVLRLLAAVGLVEKCTLKVCQSASEMLSVLTFKVPRGGQAPVSSALPLAHIVPSSSGGGLLSALGTPLLPNLRHFELHDLFCTSTLAIKEMVESRTTTALQKRGANGVRALDTVILNLTRPAPPNFDEIEDIKEIAQHSGINLGITLSM